MVIYRGQQFKTKFVGRDKEFQSLQEYIRDAVKARKGTLVLIEGETGIGKTRIIEELCQWTAMNYPSIRTLTIRCLSHERDIPYQPFIEGLRNFYLNMKARNELIPKFEKLICELIPELKTEVVATTQTLTGTITTTIAPTDDELVEESPDHLRMGLIPMAIAPAEEEEREPTEEILKHKPGITPEVEEAKAEILNTIAEVIFLLAEEQPVTIFLDDLHWADQPSLQLIYHLTQQLHYKPIVICGTYRQEDIQVPGLGAEQHPLTELIQRLSREKLYTRIVLERLSYEATCSLIQSIFERFDLPDEFLKFIYTMTEGNPFFIEEVIRVLIEDGIINLGDRQWYTKLDYKSIRIPESITDVIMHRINRLDENSVKVLAYASAIGKEFHYQLLKQIVDMDENRLLDSLDKILNLRLIREVPYTEEEIYKFDNMMIRDVAYSQLSRSRRRLLHRKIGDAIINFHKGNLGAHVYDLAYHFFEGRDYARATEYLIRAGERALQMYAMEEALKCFNRALETCVKLEPDKPEFIWKRVEVFSNLGYSYLLLADWSRALQFYYRTIELVNRYKGVWEDKVLPEPGITWLIKKQAEAYRNIGHIYRNQSKWAEAVDNFNRCIELATSIKDFHEIADAFRGLGYVHWRWGKYDLAIQYYDKCIKNTEKIQDLGVLAVIFIELGNVYNDSGDIKHGIEYYTKSIDVLQKLGDYRELARAYNNLGDVYMKEGNYDKAIEYFENCRRLCIRVRNRDMEAWALFNLAECHARKHELDPALKYCSQSLEYLVRHEDKIGIAEVYRNFGLIYRFKKDWAKSIEYYTRSIKLLEELNVPYEIGYAYHDFGLMYLDKGEFKQAEDCLRKAYEFYKRVNAKRELEKLNKDLKLLPKRSKQWQDIPLK